MNESEPEVVMVNSLGRVDPDHVGVGATGRSGERGKQGDHGQDGQDGKTGPALLTRYQTAVTIIFILFMFLLLAWRSEVNAGHIRDGVHQAERNRYDECLGRNANLVKLNALYSGLVKIERKNPFVNQSAAAAKTVQRRIDLYTSNKLTVVDCGERP